MKQEILRDMIELIGRMDARLNTAMDIVASGISKERINKSVTRDDNSGGVMSA